MWFYWVIVVVDMRIVGVAKKRNLCECEYILDSEIIGSGSYGLFLPPVLIPSRASVVFLSPFLLSGRYDNKEPESSLMAANFRFNVNMIAMIFL